MLAASQIFVDEYDTSRADQSMMSLNSSVNSRPPQEDQKLSDRDSMVELNIPSIPSEDPSRVSIDLQDPSDAPSTPGPARTRRATISTPSPVTEKNPTLKIDTDDQREKSKSQHDLGRPITPVTRLEFELEQRESIPVFHGNTRLSLTDRCSLEACSDASAVQPRG